MWHTKCQGKVCNHKFHTPVTAERRTVGILHECCKNTATSQNVNLKLMLKRCQFRPQASGASVLLVHRLVVFFPLLLPLQGDTRSCQRLRSSNLHIAKPYKTHQIP